MAITNYFLLDLTTNHRQTTDQCQDQEASLSTEKAHTKTDLILVRGAWDLLATDR